MDELHANFSDKLTFDESNPQIHLKLDLSLKNKLIKKLNEQKYADGMRTVEENGQLIASLNSLPVLIEDDGPESKINEDAVKFFKEIEFMRLNLGEFDVRKHNIVTWFKRFEFYSDLLGWSSQQRVDGLVHLLEHGLDRLVCVEKPEYELVKKNVIDLVAVLVGKDTDFKSQLLALSETFEANKFTTTERTYWLRCVTSADHLNEFIKFKCSFRGDRAIKELLALI